MFLKISWILLENKLLHSKTQQRFLCIVAVIQRGTAVIFMFTLCFVILLKQQKMKVV